MQGRSVSIQLQFGTEWNAIVSSLFILEVSSWRRQNIKVNKYRETEICWFL